MVQNRITSEEYKQIYKKFNAPITALDCGKRCAPYNVGGKPFCCDICHAVPTAYDNEWVDEDGELGPVYGKQWRSWRGADGVVVDQISQLIEDIQSKPNSRRLIVNAWNVAEIEKMALPPCHMMFQFYVAEDKLSCQLYQRSADVFLGVPFNIASYALFTLMVAQVTGLQPGDFVHTFGDAHLYNDHMEQVNQQLKRKPYGLPKMKINPEIKSIFDFKYEDFQLLDYHAHPHINGK